MNKKNLSLFALIGMAGIVMAAYLHASPRLEETYSTLEVTAASGTVFTGAGWVKSVQLSSPTASSTFGSNWMVLINTNAITNVTSYASFASGTKKTVPLLFTSTPTAITNVPQSGNNPPFVWDEPGIFFSTGCYFFKTDAASGEAFKAIIHYKK